MRDPVASIEGQFAVVESLLDDAVLAKRAALSQWSVGEQVDHLLKVSISILERVLEAKPVADKAINVVGRIIMLVRRIPRGRGRSPASLRGLPADAETLRRALDEARELMSRLDLASVRQSKALIVDHPVFGGLTAAQSLKFMLIHTAHHLRIIRDLRRAA